jgi:hypothetical protein
MFMQTAGQLEPAYSDIATAVLPSHSAAIDVAEATIPYIYMKRSWYIPCPNPASGWKSIYKIFGTLVWKSFSAVAVLAVIIMWLLVKYETEIHVRESENYKTIYRMSQEECARLREGVNYVKVYLYNPKHLYPS